MNDKVWSSKLLCKGNKFFWSFLAKSVENEFNSVTRIDLIFDMLNARFLDISERNLSFKWLIFCSHGCFKSSSSSFHIDNLITKLIGHSFWNSRFSSVPISKNDSVFNGVSKFLLENIVIPFIHSFKSEFFLKERVNIEKRQIVVFNWDYWISRSWINDSANFWTIRFELTSLLNDIWETCQYEFIKIWVSTVNNSLNHSDNHFGWNNSVTRNHLMNFSTNCCFTLILISNQSINIEIDKSVLLWKLFGNFFSKFVAVSAWSNMNDCWFNVNVDVWHSFFKALVGVNFNTSCISL